MTTIQLVQEFHEAFGVNIPKRRKASFRLMLEELIEFYDAKTDVKRLDALLDLQYFLDGTFLAYGWGDIKHEAFKEVHRSNMSKMPKDGKPLFRPDGKILKGLHFTPPDLKRFL